MKEAKSFLLCLLYMIGFYSLASVISRLGDVLPASAAGLLPTVSVYTLPMQQYTRVFTITTKKADVLSAPGGELVYQLGIGDRVTANCDFSSEPGWCQIVEGEWKGNYLWQSCTNSSESFHETDEF